MTIINVYHNDTWVRLVVQTKYWDDGGHRYSEMLRFGFKWLSQKREWVKSYHCPEYTNERYDSDIAKVKGLHGTSPVKLKRFKLVEESEL